MIRKAVSNDSERICELLKQLGYDVEYKELFESISSNSRNDEIFVSVVSMNVVGIVSLVFLDYLPSIERICRITALVVDEKYRGSGVGSKLVQFAINQAMEKRCAKLEVTTSPWREAAKQFYVSNGFVKTSFRYVQDVGN